MSSLRRLFFLFFAVVTLASGAFLAGVYWSVKRSYLLLVDEHLSREILRFEKLYADGEELGSKEVYVLRSPDGLVLDASSLELIPPFREGKIPYVENYTVNAQTYRFITVKTSKGFYLQYGVDITQAVEFFHLLKLVLLSGWLLFVLLLVFFYWFFVGKSLEGLERAVKDSLEGRQVKVHAEVQPLVDALREKFKELREQSTHYRNLLMALSHSLKTPLGRLYLKLELLQRKYKEVDLSEVRKELERIEKSSRTFLQPFS